MSGEERRSDSSPGASPPGARAMSGAPATPPLVAPARSLDGADSARLEDSDYADADSSWGGSPSSSMTNFYSPR